MMKKTPPPDNLHDDEIKQASGFTMGRCPHCDRIHLAFLDENDEVFAEMVLADADWLLVLDKMAETIKPRDPRRMM